MKDNALAIKIAQCKEIVIQNMERTIQHKMFFMYLKDRGINEQVKNFIVNGKEGMIRVAFYDHESAMKFYQQRSFNENILLRKFNIYLDIQCSSDEFKRYFLKGVNDKNMRDVFNYSRPYGVVRLNTRFNRDGTLQDKCIISFLRMQPLNQMQYQALTNSLKEVRVTIEIYREKGESRLREKYPRQMQESLMKIEQSKILNARDTIYLISVNSSEDKQSIRSIKDIKNKYLGIVEEPNRIDAYRNIVSAPEFKAEQIITVGQIEYENHKINESFIKVCDYSSQNKQFPILYLTNSKQPTSKLILFNRTSFTVRSSNGKCHILKHLPVQQKYIKVLQIPYQQIDDFYSDDKLTQITFWNPQQLQIFGREQEQ